MQHLENTFHKQIAIDSYMVDEKLRLFPTFLFFLMQDVAVRHVDHIGVGWEYLHQFNMFWALSRIDVEILRRPEWHETVEISTWGKKHNFLIQPRDHIVESLDGEVLVRATSNWVLLDTEGKPHQLDEIESLLRNQHDLHAIERPATRLRASAVTDDEPVFHPVLYSHIDMNSHVNNSYYVQWAMNEFSPEFHNWHELSLISLNYLQQMRSDDSYGIYRKEVAPNDFLLSIVSKSTKEEVCRVRTVWEPTPPQSH